MKKDFAKILISREEIAQKIKEVAAQITADYNGEHVLFVCILKGSIHFYSDLTREIDLPLTMDFMAISSYGAGTTSSGEVKMLKDLDKDTVVCEPYAAEMPNGDILVAIRVQNKYKNLYTIYLLCSVC